MTGTENRPAIVIVAIDPAGELTMLRDWYENVRIPAVTAVPGVSAAKRWEIIHRYVESPGGGMVVVPAPSDYVISYELDDVAVARNEAFLDAIGRDFSQVASVGGEDVAFDQIMSVTLREIRDAVNPGMSSDQTGAMLVVSITPEREYVDRFHEWYDREHVGELMSCPGFIRTRRYQALDGVPNFFAVYELDGPEALQSERFRHFSGRSHEELPPIHQQVGPHMSHNVCDVYRLLD